MKKALFLTLGLGAVLGLASCSDDQNKSTMTYNVQSYNLVTSVDGSKDPVVAASTYKFDFDMMNTTATVGTEITGLGCDCVVCDRFDPLHRWLLLWRRWNAARVDQDGVFQAG
ncbi:MAG: hypothetical protein HDS89_04820 [Bacteroidales bacterium]|nr:hypothetical protein [Bacteroidales bacterium]